MRARAMVALLGLALAGCTAQTPTVDPTDTGTGAPSPTESPTKKPPPKRAVRAAVVSDDRLLVYEVSNERVTEVAQGGGMFQPRWLSRSEIAIAQRSSASATVLAVNADNRAIRELVRVEGTLTSFDVSQDGAMVAVMTSRDGFSIVEVFYLVGDRAVQRVTTIPLEGRGVSIDDQFLVEFSPDAQRLLVVHTANPGGTRDTGGLQVWRITGQIEYWVDADRGPTAATWLPTGGLVFRSLDGVRRWRPGTTSSLAVGSLSSWYSPWPSQNGRLVAYDTGRTTRQVQVRRVEIASGKVVDVGPAGRANPVFAAGNQIWSQIVQRCQPDCAEPFVLGPIVYATNPNNGRDRTIPLPTLEGIAVWYE